jgi:alkylation response protein AidB-like acyl-CoA dehydrogenase
MSAAPTDERRALRDTVRRFLAEQAPIAGYVRPLLGGPAATGSGPAWDALAALGTTGVLIPEAHGGSGLGMVEAGIVAEELGRALHPGPWASSAVAAVRALDHLGVPSPELLAGIAAGTTIAAVALAEHRTSTAAGRWPWTDPATRATRRAGHTTLTGEKVDVPDAMVANVLLVVAAEEDDGAALFAVDPRHEAVEVTPHRAVDPTRPQYRVRLDAAPARRVGPAGREAVQALVDDVLAVRAADALGAAQAVLELAVEHAKSRIQFGRPIGAFQAVQHLCVDMHETVELARGGVAHALWAADRADPAERHLAATRAKAFSARLATVGDTAIQVLGGIGFTWEHDAHLHLRRLLAWQAFLGPPGPYLRELGAHLAGAATRRPDPVRSPA